MLKLLALAARNLGRNLRRTLITLAAISLGLAVMVWVVVLQAGQHHDMRRTAISTMAGHVVAQGAHFQDDRRPEYALDGAASVVQQLHDRWPDATVTQRIWLDGLLSSANSASACAVTAVDPVEEAQVQTVDDQVREGAWLDATDDRAIVLGAGLARSLGVGVGDKVVFMGQFGQKDVQSRMFRVRGIFRTGAAELDGFTAWITHPAGQELLGRPDATHQIALHLPPNVDDELAALDVRAIVPPPGEVLHWQQALPDLWALLNIDARSNDIIMGIFGIIVAMGVLNTLLMSVLERSREFGVLLAIGMRPARIVALVLTEAFVLGLLGATLGMALGVALAWPLVTTGLDFTEAMGESIDAGGVVVSALIKGTYDVERLSTYYIGAVLFTFLAGVYPAWQVTRFTPVDAMRKV